jgi:hypothetical protein
MKEIDLMPDMMRTRRFWLFALVGVGAVFLLLQLVPVKTDNPPVLQEPAWDSPETRALVKESCFDCHSNETQYPWYSHVAPMKFLIAHDVEEGRSFLNFSEWGTREMEVDELIEVLQDEMPPLQYKLIHPATRLTDEERQTLIAGFQRTFGVAGEEGEKDEDD